MFGHVLDQRQEAALGVVPRVRPEFLVVGLQGFNHAGNSELIVTLGAIQSSTKTGLNFLKKSVLFKYPKNSIDRNACCKLPVLVIVLTKERLRQFTIFPH